MKLRGFYFYSQVVQNVFITTHTRFLEDDYMMTNKSKSKVNYRALDDTPTIEQNTMDLILTIPISSTSVPHCSMRVVIQLDWFMYLGESFDMIPKEHEINHMDYGEAMSMWMHISSKKKTMEV